MAFITFVTTCRGRLNQLRKSLPSFVRQPDAAVVVVDYGCPDGSGDWVEANFPTVEVVRSPESQRFEAARARNLGAARARTPWICFIDADMEAANDFSARVKPLLKPGRFYHPGFRHLATFGTCICAAKDFVRIGGYDEVIQGWGNEDQDFYARLLLSGVGYSTFPNDTIKANDHADGQRVTHYEVKDRWVSESINHVYCSAKMDLFLLQRTELGLALRKKLYAEVHAAVMKARNSGKAMAIALPLTTHDTRACGPLQAKLMYALPRPRGDGKPNAGAASLVARALRHRVKM